MDRGASPPSTFQLFAALVLVAGFGHETRGTDLREFDESDATLAFAE